MGSLSLKKCTLLLLFSLLSSACTPTPPTARVKDGITYGTTKGLFNHRWWNYYERGCSFAEGEFWKEAENDFIEAIKKRENDQRRARTYGMHFIDYFPHRELGILYYKTDRLTEAIKELELSLKLEESAKATYFYNKARAAVISRDKTDVTPPRIAISNPPEDLITNDANLVVTGVASDDTLVSSIHFNRRPLFIELSEKRMAFSRKLPLTVGENTISVKAIDISGKETTISRQVILDVNAPMISIADILPQSDGSLRVNGHLSDENGIARFELNGEPQQFRQGERELSFSKVVTNRNFHFLAKDLAGNISRQTFALDGQQSAAHRGSGRLQNRIVLASLASDQFAAAMFHAAKKTARQKTYIALKSLSENQTTYVDKVFLEGTLSDNDTIVSFFINGVSFDFRPGKQIYFNYLLQLHEGENTISMQATDALGNISTRVITIHRKIPTVRAIGSRMTVAVIPFTQTSQSGSLADLAFDLFQTRVFSRKRFHLVVRKDLDKVLEELHLSQTELVNPATAARVGKLVVADNIVTGSVYQQKESVEVTIHFINTETSSLMASMDVFSESSGMKNMNYLMEGLALKLEKEFPLLEGLIIKVKDGKFYLDLGENKGIKKEMQLIAFREGEKIIHPITGRLLGTDTKELAKLVISSVQEDYSIAQLRQKNGVQVKEMDKFITR